MKAAELIDSHCHLDFDSFDTDRSSVMQRAHDNKINHIIIPGTKKIYWDRIKTLCYGSQQLHACYGLHPYWIEEHEEKDLLALEAFIELNRPVALGECGLDFRPQQADRDLQIKFFIAQLEIAARQNLPVVIHSVRATETVIQILKEYKNLHGMIHSFSGSSEQANQLIEMNFYISISGSVTYGNAKKLQQTVKRIPLTSMLLETDAPDQADENHHGERNEPSYIIDTLQKITEIRGEDKTTIAEQTTTNAKTLFGI